MTEIIQIKDFQAPELDVYARLTENQLINHHEPEKGLFIAESPLCIGRALDAGYLPVSILVEDRHVETQAKEIIERCGEIPVYTASFDTLTQLTGFQLTRGMLCAMRRPRLPSLEAVCSQAKTVAVLENVMNPTNIGAVFRSAAALNMDAVILTANCSNPLYRRAIRVSMGTVFQIPWTILEEPEDTAMPKDPAIPKRTEMSEDTAIQEKQGESMRQCGWLKRLSALGYRTAAMALSDRSVSIDDPHLMAEEKLAIILGSEGCGLLPETIEACDYTVKIPMTHGVDSLNVAAASAVTFWQLGHRK